MISQCKLCHHHSNCHCSACPMVSGCLNSTLGMRKSTHKMLNRELSDLLLKVLETNSTGKNVLKNLLFLFYTTGRKYKIKRAHFSFFKDFQVLFTKSKHFSRPWRRNFVFKHFFSFSRIRTHPDLMNAPWFIFKKHQKCGQKCTIDWTKHEYIAP